MCIPQGNAGATGQVGLGLQVAGAFSSALGAANESKYNKAAYEYQAAVARNNAQIDDYRATDALERGALDVNKHQLKVAALKGSQRAAFAARGLALDEGSALNILRDTDYLGDVDAATITDSAAREAWALREQSKGGRANAAMLSSRAASESPLRSAATSLLSSGGSVAKSWYALRDRRAVSGDAEGSYGG
jgi:hypothetical protein